VFHFAWCDSGQPFDDSMLREDEIIFAFDLAHQEGQIPTLSIDVKNPHIGLLAPGRQQWAWLSYSDQTGTYPLFFGRLVGLPTNLLGEVVTLQFIARPDDFLDQKQAIADGLMVEPWYDPIWISADKFGDPDTVLEAYTMAWHVDRITNAVSVSDIVFGEDGTVEFKAEDSFYDSVSISFAQAPQTQVVCDGTVQWTQSATGIIPLPDVSLSAWNGDQIVNDWPKIGDNLGGGWSVEYSAVTNFSDQFGGSNPITINVGGDTSSSSGGAQDTGSPADVGSPPLTQGDFGNIPSGAPKTSLAKTITLTYQNQAKEHFNGDVMSVNENVQYDEEGKLGGKIVSSSTSMTIGDPATGTAAAASFNYSYTRTVGEPQVAPPTAPPTPVTIVVLPGGGTQEQGGGPITIPSLFGSLSLSYDLSFGRTETITFTMDSDIQPIVLLSPDDTSNQITLSMHGSDLGLPIEMDGSMPIGDPGRSAFFPTDRGQLALQYPMLVARASLVQSARAAKINFDCTFEAALGLSCRMNALLHDSRLPGGQVIGKITEYHLKADGDKGQLIGSVQIEATVGNDSAITVGEGNASYVAEGYAVSGYQHYIDLRIALVSGDADIMVPTTELVENQMSLPLTYGDVVQVFQVHEGSPVDTVIAGGAATADPTWLEVVLTPVTGQDYTTTYDLGASTVVLPKMIDLAAASA
jgi:hypothetical protein